MNSKERAKSQSLIFVIILGALTAIGALSIDMFLSGLPDIQNDFHTTTSNAQLTLSLFMIGLALGNLFAGPISDSIGRRKPLWISMLIYTIASLGIVFVTNIQVMIALRFIQGITGGAASVISRAIASDMYKGKELTKFLSLLMLVNGVAPVIAPAIGGVILSFAVWRMVFIILTVFGVLMVIGTLTKVPESLQEDEKDSNGIREMFKNFKHLLFTPKFVLPMAIQGFSFIMLFTYISASPFIVQKIYHMSALQFSIMFAGIGITLIISSQLVGFLVDYVDRQRLLKIVTFIQIFGVVLVIFTLLNHMSFWILVIGFIILVSPVTAVASLGFSIATMDESTRGRGSASSLLGLVQFLLGGVMSSLVNVMGEHNVMPYVTIISSTAIILIILQLLNSKIHRNN